MPLFSIKGKNLTLVKPTNFKLEKELQQLIEQNLERVFDCRYVASEFSTGAQHAGRIDTLALSEDNHPVIIEYKKRESSELITQSLYYLSWMYDHRGDFQIAVNKSFGKDTEVDWTQIRVICIAPGFSKFDLHAVKAMGANIELWQYRLLGDQSLYLEEVFKRTNALSFNNEKNAVYLSPGEKAANTRATGSYSVEEHLTDADDNVRKIFAELRDFILGLDESIEEAPKKLYIAYKTTQNFVCVQFLKSKITLFLKVEPSEISPLPSYARDVTNIGHYGTGNLEITLKTMADLEDAQEYVVMALNAVGGG